MEKVNDQVVEGRRIVGYDIRDEGAWCDVMSVSVLKSFPSKEHEDVVEMQVKCVPSHLYPAKGETEETMLDRFRSDDFLDVEFH